MSPSSACSFRSALVVALALAPRTAPACPCGPGAAPVTSLTTPDEAFALRLSVAALTETATWDDRARAWPSPAAVRTRRVIVELAGAWRPGRRVELMALVGGAYTAADQPGVTVRAASLGDVTVRARWEAHDGPAWRVALSGAVRAPTGSAVTGTLANGVAGLGLGAWELALGGEVARRSPDRGEVGVAAEAGLRAPAERAQGGTWTPGPRVSVTAFGAWRATPVLTWTASVSHVLELDAWRDGERVDGSGARRTTVATGLNLRVASALWSASIAADPWVDGLGANATATLRATVGVTWVR
jgi:hypothetical protein